MKKLNVLVAGSTGYIGIQLVKLLCKHKFVKIRYLCGNSSIGKKIESYDIMCLHYDMISYQHKKIYSY